MAIQVTSFLIPKGGNKWYVLEDKYIRGGFQVVADEAERDAIEPDNRKAGMLVMVQATNKIYQMETSLTSWREFQTGGGNPVRQTAEYSTADLNPAGSESFSLSLGRTCLILGLSVDTPCKVEAFGTAQRDESNPYVFIATSDHLEDDGSTALSDGTIYRGRRFTFLANMEDGGSTEIYFRITNTGSLSKNVNLKVQFLPLESVSL